MATLKIIEYKAGDKSVDVVIAVRDMDKELGRVTVSISPEWTKREALAEIGRAVEKFTVTQKEKDKVVSLVREVDGIPVESFIAR